VDIAEQHRANCHESSAAKGLTLLPAGGGLLRQSVDQVSVRVLGLISYLYFNTPAATGVFSTVFM